MSYCWPVPQQDDDGKDIQEERNYQVRDLDGTTRKSRALDDVIDRTADVANSLGLRMIWIDQECLPQPDERSPQDEKHEQQIRVQSMDILYSRAMITGGLHSLELSNQSQVNAISSAMQPDYSAGRCDDCHHLNDFLDRVSQERRYQRAWVAQEMLSVGSRLFLVIRLAGGISYPLHFRLSHSGLVSVFNVDGPCSLDNSSDDALQVPIVPFGEAEGQTLGDGIITTRAKSEHQDQPERDNREPSYQQSQGNVANHGPAFSSVYIYLVDA